MNQLFLIHNLGKLIILLLALTSSCVQAVVELRNQEIAECSQSEIKTWEDNRDTAAKFSPIVFYYDHTGAPAWFSEKQVSELIERAASAWSQCGIPALVVNKNNKAHPSTSMVSIDWNIAGSRGNFGLANLTQNQLSLGLPAFQLLNQRNPKHNALETLQMVLSHEMGHFYGMLAHSRRCIDVLSYYHDGKGGQCYSRFPDIIRKFPEYRSTLPTACDIQRCKILNRKD
jgi:uncharacterized protein YfcZ (UPF0381/DUF406 family)